MSTIDLQNFISKQEAARTAGCHPRTFTGWISDALEHGDAEFLRHLKLRTSDKTEGDMIRAGTDVTSEMIVELNAHRQRPLWFVDKAFAASLKGKGKGSRAAVKPVKKVKSGAGESRKQTKLTGASKVQQLEHELAIEQESNRAKEERIESLKEDNDFYKAELEARRNEIDKVRQLFQTVGDAAESTAQLQSGAGKQTDAKSPEEGSDAPDTSGVVEANNVTAKSGREKHTPNFHAGIQRVKTLFRS